MTQEVRLQQILGGDKPNPQFSLLRDGLAPGMIYVFYGADLLEVVAEDKSHAQFKLLIARLYNAAVKAKALTDTFGVARTTMKRWGDALAALQTRLAGAAHIIKQRVAAVLLGAVNVEQTKLLKGWCPNVRRPDKALHMEFIHTAAGEPVFVEHADNFHDVRERFPQTVTQFRRMMGFEDPTHLTFIVDRGLFTMELFTAARQAHNHIITWEKGYKRGQWDESKVAGSFVMMRPRNSANDCVRVTLCPTMQYPSQLRRTVNAFLQRVNNTAPPMPDGSPRTIRFRLHQKTSTLSAIDTDRFPGIY